MRTATIWRLLSDIFNYYLVLVISGERASFVGGFDAELSRGSWWREFLWFLSRHSHQWDVVSRPVRWRLWQAAARRGADSAMCQLVFGKNKNVWYKNALLGNLRASFFMACPVVLSGKSSSSLSLGDVSVSIGVKQFFEVGYLRSQLGANVGVVYEHAVGRHLYYLRGRLDVRAPQNGILGAGKRLVLHQLEAAAVVDERVPCDASLFVIGLREASVYHH